MRNRYEERRVDPSASFITARRAVPAGGRLLCAPEELATGGRQSTGSGNRRRPRALPCPGTARTWRSKPRPPNRWPRWPASSTSFPDAVLFTAESAGRREVLLELLDRLKLNRETVDSWPDFVAAQGAPGDHHRAARRGPAAGRSSLALIAGKPAVRPAGHAAPAPRKRAEADDDAVIKNLTELREGAPVVHIDHGVGRYLGPGAPWRSTARPPSSSPSNTPRAPSSTCRWPACT